MSTFSAAQIWLKITRWCDYQERAHQEVRDKLYALGLHKSDVEQTIAKLVEEGFINEERFAKAFASGKFRIVKWGKIKIMLALRQKKISEYCIKSALNSIDEDEYKTTIRLLYLTRLGKGTSVNDSNEKYKAARYVISRGFEPETVYNIMESEKPY